METRATILRPERVFDSDLALFQRLVSRQAWITHAARGIGSGTEQAAPAQSPDRSRNTTWVSGYNNDLLSYVPSLRVLKEGGYEGVTGMFEYGHRAPYTEEVEERIAGKVDDLVRQVLPKK